MARIVKDHTVLPATHAFIHEWNEPYHIRARLRNKLRGAVYSSTAVFVAAFYGAFLISS